MIYQEEMPLKKTKKNRPIPRNSPESQVFNWGFIFRMAEDQILNLIPKE